MPFPPSVPGTVIVLPGNDIWIVDRDQQPRFVRWGRSRQLRHPATFDFDCDREPDYTFLPGDRTWFLRGHEQEAFALLDYVMGRHTLAAE